jgi:lipoate-protein ligase A
MESGPLATIAGTNAFIMERQRRAAERASGLSVRVEGHTDLAVGGMKFSGNAQRRRRNALLFHGTVLHDFDLEVIARWLRFPSARPAYRGGRGHLDFLRNLPASPEGIREAIAAEWDARPARRPLPTERHATALRERYDIAAWHARA